MKKLFVLFAALFTLSNVHAAKVDTPYVDIWDSADGTKRFIRGHMHVNSNTNPYPYDPPSSGNGQFISVEINPVKKRVEVYGRDETFVTSFSCFFEPDYSNSGININDIIKIALSIDATTEIFVKESIATGKCLNMIVTKSSKYWWPIRDGRGPTQTFNDESNI